YLEKQESEILASERRQKAGKSIGSGRMEKGVDQVIGARQKSNGMSWRPTGSKALGTLKVVELNGQWDQLWVPEKAAACSPKNLQKEIFSLLERRGEQSV